MTKPQEHTIKQERWHLLSKAESWAWLIVVTKWTGDQYVLALHTPRDNARVSFCADLTKAFGWDNKCMQKDRIIMHTKDPVLHVGGDY